MSLMMSSSSTSNFGTSSNRHRVGWVRRLATTTELAAYLCIIIFSLTYDDIALFIFATLLYMHSCKTPRDLGVQRRQSLTHKIEESYVRKVHIVKYKKRVLIESLEPTILVKMLENIAGDHSLMITNASTNQNPIAESNNPPMTKKKRNQPGTPGNYLTVLYHDHIN
ncbi:hypothetical protein Syun_027649 [Stephania yunnanensis]|uniref:Uncharacterized protein n=1 Tax=Stephania yunnanensis TaxID=152371 RepID=A0AAP0EN94_9MAGN